jgi:hypothetical protein
MSPLLSTTVMPQEDVLQHALIVDQLVNRDAGSEGDLTDPLARCSPDEQRVVGTRRHL